MPDINLINILRSSLSEELKKNFNSIEMGSYNISKADILDFFDKYPHYFYYNNDNSYTPVNFITFLSSPYTLQMIQSFKEREMRARAKADNKQIFRRLLHSLLDGSFISIKEKMNQHNLTKEDVLEFFEERPDSLIHLLTKANAEELVKQANNNLEDVTLKMEDMAESMMKLIENYKQENPRIKAETAKGVNQCTYGIQCYPGSNEYLLQNAGKSKKYRKKTKKYRKKSKKSRKSRKGRFPHKKSRNKRK